MKINNLTELRKVADEETIRRMFMEYFMELNAKAEVMDKAKNIESAYQAGYLKGYDDAENGL